MAEEQAAAGAKRRHVGCEGTPGQGPYMAVVLEIQDDMIQDAKFQTYGCPAAASCGEFVCDWSQGRSVASALTLTTDELIQGIGPPPLGREHCPGLAVKALHKALQSPPIGSGA